MTRARDLALLAGFFFSLVGVAMTPWCTRDRVPEPAPWVEAVRQHAGALAKGSVVLIHPPWRDDVVRAVRAAGVVPEGVVVTASIAPRHGDVLPPLFIVAETGGVALPRNLRGARLSDVGGGIRIGALTLDAAARLSRRDVLDELPQAKVEVTLAGRRIACSWDAVGQRHACPELPEWMHVGVEEHRIDGRPQRCAWAHPITNGELSITFSEPDVRGSLELALALTDGAAANESGAEVTATLFVDDEERARVSRKNRRGFASAHTAIAAPPRSVRVVVTTPHDGQRHACIQLSSGAAP